MAETEVKAHIGFEVDDKPLEKLHKGIEALKEGLFGLTATLVESGVALYETVVKTSEAGEAAIKLGQQTGIGAEKIQELQYAAKLAGVESESLTRGLVFLQRNMFQVAQGGGALNDIFTKFGIRIKNQNGTLRNANDVLGDLADRFRKMPDGAEKTGLAVQYFGRQGAALIPVLNKGRAGLAELGQEAKELGAVLSDKDAAAGKEFQDSLKTLMAALTGIRNVVASELLPAFTEIVQEISGWIKANRKLIQSDLKGFLQATVVYLKAVFSVFLKVADSIAGFTHILGGAENATKAFLFVIGLIAGTSILFGIGKLIQSVYAFATAFTVADAAALLIPIAIGLAIVAIGLLVEDIYQFFTGGDSVIGRIVKAVPEIGRAFQNIFGPIMEPIFGIVSFVLGGFKDWKAALKDLGALIINILLLPLRAVQEVVGGVIGLIGRIPGFGGLKQAGAAIQDYGGYLSAPTTIPGTGGATTNNTSGNSNVTVNAPTTVTVPPGTPPALVGDKVSQGVSDGVARHLREASRATQTAVAY